MPSSTLEYLDTAETADRFLKRLAQTRELAIDTEGASFHRFIDRIYLIQLSTRDANAVIDPLSAGTLAPLGAILEDPAVEVVFHDADYDLRLLHQDYGWHPRCIFDTRIAAQLLGHKAVGLAALLEKYFDVRLDKKHQRADWSMRPLPPAMLEYAVQDTANLLALRDHLRDELRRAGRLAWAEEEFARLEGTRWAPEEPGQAFLRIKGARDLERRQLALLKELAAWRDEVAGKQDRATFRVATNETLIDIVRAAPTTPDALGRVKGVAPWVRQKHGDAVLAAVRRGLDVPESELPRFPKSPRWQRDADFDARVAAIRTVRDVAASKLDLDPGMLFSRERMEAVARIRPKTREELEAIEGVRRWHVEVLGPELLRAASK